MTIPKILSTIFSDGASKLVDSIGTAIDKNITSTDEKEKNKSELTKIVNDGILEMQKEVDSANENTEKELTERLKIDSSGDSWLAKNIRPLTLVFLNILFLIMIFFDRGTTSIFHIEAEYKSTIKELLLSVYAFYFIGRTVEKGISIKNQ